MTSICCQKSLNNVFCNWIWSSQNLKKVKKKGGKFTYGTCGGICIINCWRGINLPLMEYVYIFPSHECSSSLAKRLNLQQDFSLFFFSFKNVSWRKRGLFWRECVSRWWLVVVHTNPLPSGFRRVAWCRREPLCVRHLFSSRRSTLCKQTPTHTHTKV